MIHNSNFRIVFDQEEVDAIVRQLEKFGFFSMHHYRSSDEWLALRESMRFKLPYVCQKCGKTRSLSLHHKTHQRLCEEVDDDLVLLCMWCSFASYMVKPGVDWSKLKEREDMEERLFDSQENNKMPKHQTIYKTLERLACSLGYMSLKGKYELLRKLMDYAKLHPDLFRL